ncbi:hypothetical protein [Aestuariivirga sp.]|uniref:hypothetical protein n=1 Tax=Aestuariivirga sp. TaxID=2650926 RepID=UPI003593EC4C
MNIIDRLAANFGIVGPRWRFRLSDYRQPGERGNGLNAGQLVQIICFPSRRTLKSFLVLTEESGAVEAMPVEREVAGGGILTLPVLALDAARVASRAIDNLFSRYTDCMVAQMFQAAACNAAHTTRRNFRRAWAELPAYGFAGAAPLDPLAGAVESDPVEGAVPVAGADPVAGAEPVAGAGSGVVAGGDGVGGGA